MRFHTPTWDVCILETHGSPVGAVSDLVLQSLVDSLEDLFRFSWERRNISCGLRCKSGRCFTRLSWDFKYSRIGEGRTTSRESACSKTLTNH
jgi:hypothetical protein